MSCPSSKLSGASLHGCRASSSGLRLMLWSCQARVCVESGQNARLRSRRRLSRPSSCVGANSNVSPVLFPPLWGPEYIVHFGLALLGVSDDDIGDTDIAQLPTGNGHSRIRRRLRDLCQRSLHRQIINNNKEDVVEGERENPQV